MITKILAFFDKIEAFSEWSIHKRYNFLLIVIVIGLGTLIFERNNKVSYLESKTDTIAKECRLAKDLLRKQIQDCNTNLFNYISESEKQYRDTMFEVMKIKNNE